MALGNSLERGKIAGMEHYLPFLAPLAEGQRAIVMALCLSCVHLLVCPFVRECMHP